MARPTASPTTPDGKQASVAAIEAASGTPKDGFDWDAMAAPIAMPTRNTFTGIKVDVLKTIPSPLRERAERQLIINTERVKANANSQAKRNRVDYHWDLQPVTTAEMGEQFVKLLTKYAKYRPSEGDIPHAGPNVKPGQVTARVGAVSHFVKGEDDTYEACDASAAGAVMGVRYSVRPFEVRNSTAKLPGS